MKNVRRRVIGRTTAVVLVGALVSVAACSSSGDESESTTTTPQAVGGNDLVDEGTPVKGGSLVFGVRAETPGWNPATSQWAQEGQTIGSSMIEPLFVNNVDGEPVGWLAESATPNADFTTWTIELREGIMFHDGSELQANAVVDTLNLMRSDEALASFAYGDLVGEPVATGTYTVDVPLSQPYGVFPVILTNTFGYVMAPSMLASPDKGAADPVGTGAYRFEKAEAGRYVRVNAFEDYWGGPCVVDDPAEDVVQLCEEMGVPLGQPNGPFLDQIEFRPIVDSLQRTQSLQQGDVDLMMTTTPSATASLRDDFQVVTDYDAEQAMVMLKTTNAPFDNIHARKALAHATDRQAIKELVGSGEDIGMDTSPFEEGSRWGGLAPDETGYPVYDPEKAKEELEAYKADMAEAGTPVETLSFELINIANPEDTAVAQVLNEQWSELGIEVDLKAIAQEALAGQLVGAEWQAIMFRNYANPDPDANYIFWSEESATGDIAINFTEFYNATTQDAIDRGRTSADVETRREAYSELVAERNANVVELWLFNTPWAIVADQDVRGLNPFRSLGFAPLTSRPFVSGLWVDPNG